MKNANLDLKNLPELLAPVLAAIKKYGVFMFFVLIMAIYAFLVFDINHLSSAEPSEDSVNEKLKTAQVPRLDPDTLKKIQELQDQNVQVKTLFDQARNNPFAE